LLAKIFSEQLASNDTADQRAVRFRRSAFALREVGVIESDEAYRWIDRFQRQRGLPTPSEQDELDRARTCTALELRGVIAAPMAVGDLRISHLELYADGALLYSLETGRGGTTCGADPRSANPFARRPERPALTVGDDLGTVYEPRQYHGFAKALTPAAPEAASRLELSFRGAVGEISLR